MTNPRATEPQAKWNMVSCPISADDPLPAERKVVLVWVRGASFLPFCAYVRYASGCKDSPYFVVYNVHASMGTDVIAWCDCLPDEGPEWPTAAIYSTEQKTGQGYPARPAKGGAE